MIASRRGLVFAGLVLLAATYGCSSRRPVTMPLTSNQLPVRIVARLDPPARLRMIDPSRESDTDLMVDPRLVDIVATVVGVYVFVDFFTTKR